MEKRDSTDMVKFQPITNYFEDNPIQIAYPQCRLTFWTTFAIFIRQHFGMGGELKSYKELSRSYEKLIQNQVFQLSWTAML